MPPSREDGRSFKENQPGQYIYDPMFCIHGYEDEASVVPLPFQSYIDVPLQKNPSKVKLTHVSGKDVSTAEDKSKTRSQNKTPRTMLKMMERHRENERVRHHTLNKSMKKVCDKVPGSSPFRKETKVIMMQRIIAYICYLENTISCVCSQLGIKQLRMSTNFITEQWSLPEKSKEEMIVVKHKIPLKQSKKSLIEKRRLKLSSPTIDSTTDNICQTVSRQLVGNSQDSQGVSSTHVVNEDLFMDDNVCCDHYEESYLNEDFLPSSTKFDNFPDAFDLMSSPIGNLPSHRNIDCSDECGIQRDNHELEMCDSPLRTISPECVLQTSLSQSSYTTTPIKYVITPTKYRNKRKQSTPQRSPFSNITNISPRKRQTKLMKTESKFSKKCPVDEDFVSYAPYIWKFHKSSVSRRKKIDIENEIPLNQQSTTVMAVADSKVEKIDHRKTTWMNGFMMFSRLNRRSFIEANPGVHTSYISKMMGHAWRQMTSDDQCPYREKAKDYASTMKNMICEESISSDDL